MNFISFLSFGASLLYCMMFSEKNHYFMHLIFLELFSCPFILSRVRSVYVFFNIQLSQCQERWILPEACPWDNRMHFIHVSFWLWGLVTSRCGMQGSLSTCVSSCSCTWALKDFQNSLNVFPASGPFYKLLSLQNSSWPLCMTSSFMANMDSSFP